jgi:hypothetical protein
MKFQGLDYFVNSNTAMSKTLFFFLNRNFTVHPIDETPSTQCLEEPGQTHKTCLPGFFNSFRKHIMNRKTLSALSLSLAALVAGNAFAADASAPKTREQVRAELVQAQSTGDIQAQGNSGKLLNELYPDRYPAKAVAQSKTRDQVLAELEEAQRTGNILAQGNSGKLLNELYPSQYPAKAVTQGLTRAQVVAELEQAQRSGDDFGQVYGHH